MSDGQLAMNTNLVSPGLFLKDSNGDLVKIGPVHVGATAPNATPGAGGQAGNSKGEQWLDTSSSRYVFKIWDGTAWRTEDGEFVNASGDTMTGALVMDNQQQVRFRETTANGTNYVGFQAPASIAADLTWTLPAADGTVGQVLSTNGTGTLGWIAAGGLAPYSITITAVSKTLVDRERCTVTASGQTITLPATPAAGAEVAVTVAGTFTDTILARNGSNIMNLAENITIDVADVSVTVYYVDATRGWRII